MSTVDRSPGVPVPEWLVTNRKAVFLESVVSIALVWWVVAAALNLSDVISSPPLVAAAAYELLVSMEWVTHLVATLWRTVVGAVLTVVVGTAVGVLMGFSDFWAAALKDYVIVGMALPSLFAAIFAAMWFGIGNVTPIAAATILTFPFITQIVYEAVEDIDTDLVSMSRSFDVSRGRLVRRVVVQSIAPSLFAGGRYAFSVSWKIVTLAELIAAENGVGFMIEQQLQFRSITGVITWTLLFTLVILVIEYGVLQRVERRVFDWRGSSEIAW